MEPLLSPRFSDSGSSPRSSTRALSRSSAGSGQAFGIYCMLGSVLGFVGYALTIVASVAELCDIVDNVDAAYNSPGTLTRWPSTISELNSDFTSARGRLFFGFMLATATLLFLSKMPYELDSLPFEESLEPPENTGDRQGEDHTQGQAAEAAARQRAWDAYTPSAPHVCCLADCAPCCEFPWRPIVVRLPPFPCKSGNNTSGEEPICCHARSGAACETSLVYVRGIIIPLGVVFVALMPTLNFWSRNVPGAGVTRAVHLLAAGCLFAGGTIAEAVRMYFLWCESRQAGILAGHVDARSTSCHRFLCEQRISQAEGIGPMRPWLLACLLVGLVGAALSLHEDEKYIAPSLQVDRGDVLLSPEGTAFCPAPKFKYLEIHTLAQCNAVTERLRMEWKKDLMEDARQANEKKFWTRSALIDDFIGTSKPDASAEACLVSAGARLSRKEFPMDRGISERSVGTEESPPNSEILAHSSGFPPNTMCNVMNFNETAGRCVAHTLSTPMEFLTRCDNISDRGECVSTLKYGESMQCAPGGFPKDSSKNFTTCCKKTLSKSCCEKTCRTAKMPYAYNFSTVPKGDDCFAKSDTYSFTFMDSLMDLNSNFTCASAIILPSYVAICVCDPDDKDIPYCQYEATKPASTRLQLFVQESALAILLLMTYMAIGIEHALRNPTIDPQPTCRVWTMRLVLASMPMFLAIASFTVHTYIDEHNVGGNLVSRSPCASWAVVVGQLLEPAFYYYGIQLRLYWISGVLMLVWIGNSMLAEGRPYLLGTFLMLTMGTLIVFVPWVLGIVTDWDKFWNWLLSDLMLLVACVATWLVKSTQWLLPARRLSSFVVGSCMSAGLVLWPLLNPQYFASRLLWRLLWQFLWQFDLFVLALWCGRNCTIRCGYSVVDGYADAVPLVVTPTTPVSTNLLNDSTEVPLALSARTGPVPSQNPGGIGDRAREAN